MRFCGACGAPLAELSSCLFMGTVVHEGSSDAVVVATGAATQFGRIAIGLGVRVRVDDGVDVAVGIDLLGERAFEAAAGG